MKTYRVELSSNEEPIRIELLIRGSNSTHRPPVRRCLILKADWVSALEYCDQIQAGEQPNSFRVLLTPNPIDLTMTVEDEVLESQDPVVIGGLYGRRARISEGIPAVRRTREEFLASMSDEYREAYLTKLAQKRAQYVNLDGQVLERVMLDDLWSIPEGIPRPPGSKFSVAPAELPPVGDSPIVVDFESWGVPHD
jgi:hypothetical protein